MTNACAANTSSALQALATRVLETEQWPLLEHLYEQVFGHVLPRELTAWKYAPGRGLSVAVLDIRDATKPQALAHCGLMFRDLLVQGRAARAAQITDLMVAPSARAGLARGGSPFAKAVALAFEQLGGPANAGNPERIVYGFPSGRAMRLGERLHLFREVDQVHELHWAPRPGPLPARLDGPDSAAIVDALWETMRRDLGGSVVGVRDAQWFLPRYLEHPTRSYQVHVVRSRWWGYPQAVLATQTTAQGLELSDWVAPLRHTAMLLRAARALAAHQRAKLLHGWMTRRHLALMAPEAQAVSATEFRILARGDISADAFALQQNRWWLTPGDTDYR
jgi:hypothetical protein